MATTDRESCTRYFRCWHQSSGGALKGHTRYPVVIVFVGALEGRHRYCHFLRHCYTEPMKGALGLLIELSDIIVEHRTKHAEGRLCATK